MPEDFGGLPLTSQLLASAAPRRGLPRRSKLVLASGPESDANDPRRKRLTDPEPSGLLAPAGGCTRARTTPAWVDPGGP